MSPSYWVITSVLSHIDFFEIIDAMDPMNFWPFYYFPSFLTILGLNIYIGKYINLFYSVTFQNQLILPSELCPMKELFDSEILLNKNNKCLFSHIYTLIYTKKC